MFGGLNRLLSAILVAGAVTAAIAVAPAAASGCGSGTSAAQVYKECQQNGGGGSNTGSQTSTSGGSQPGSQVTVHHYTSQTQKALNKAGKDKSALAALLKTSGARRLFAAKGSTSSPSAVGSAFDLTSGPTALLVVLAGTALLLVAGSGMRVWRGRRRV